MIRALAWWRIRSCRWIRCCGTFTAKAVKLMEAGASKVKSRTCFDHQRLAGEPEGWSSGCEGVDQVMVLGRIWRGLVMAGV